MSAPRRVTSGPSPTRLRVILLLSIVGVDLGTTTLSIALHRIGLSAGLVAVIDAITLTSILLPVLLFLVFRPQVRHIQDLEQAESALRAMHDHLELRVRERTVELEQRNREIGLLAEMSDLLQACVTTEEAYSVITRAGHQLLPDTIGVLFVYSASRNDLEALATWGEVALNQNETVFAPDGCWGLRRGKLYRFEDPSTGLRCRHVPSSVQSQYLCVPMTAKGEVLGLLHLRYHQRPAELGDTAAPLSERPAMAMAEYVALALTNLKLQEKLRSQTIRDPLTGLFNRRYMEETLERELQRAKRNQGPLGLVLLDLDHFKRFNDTHGHDAGDLILRAVSESLRIQTRGADIACRYGGEEFTLVLPEMPLDIVRQRVEALCLGIKQLHLQHRGQSLGTVTVSAGIAMFPEHGATGESLFGSADQALYRAKREGRDRVAISETRAGES